MVLKIIIIFFSISIEHSNQIKNRMDQQSGEINRTPPYFKRALRSGAKRKSDGSLETLEKLKGDYEKKYRRSSETWQENINFSVTQTLKKLESKEKELKNQYDTLLKMESVVMNYEKNLVEKEKEMDERCRKKMQVSLIFSTFKGTLLINITEVENN